MIQFRGGSGERTITGMKVPIFFTLLPALTVVLTAAACGTAQAPTSTPPLATPAPTVDPVRGDCQPTLSHVPFQPVLPTYLPDGVKFLEACTHEDPLQNARRPFQNVELYYYDDARTAWFQVVTANVDVQPQGRETIQMGNVVGYVTRTPRPDGTTLYGVEMQLEGRAYTVIAILGAGVNALSEDDLNRVAESMAAAAGG